MIGLFIIGLLIIIAIQDLKYRAVSWIVFPILFITTIVMVRQSHSWLIVSETFMYNSVFVIAQLLLVTIYISIKHNRIVNITTKYLGWGDILFLFVTSSFFSFFNFILFYIISLSLILFTTILVRILKRNLVREIPLAGGMAIILSIIHIEQLLFRRLDYYDNGMLFTLLSG
ncbi:MAG: hypothetical protein IIA45_04260 [Bacteroidetes bacterium]|nr:hypothetical protein [Bacteroidota bacterium]